MTRTIAAGLRIHLVTVQNPGEPVPDGEGGYTTPMAPLDPPTMFAQIQTASMAAIERTFAGTVIATATHIVTMAYHPGVTLQTVITFQGATYHVVNRVNRDERNIELVLLCAEQVA